MTTHSAVKFLTYTTLSTGLCSLALWLGDFRNSGVAATATNSNISTTLNTDKIINEILRSEDAYSNLKELTDIGPRLSASAGAARAIEWARNKLSSYKVDRVILQPVEVPHWTRGEIESGILMTTGADGRTLKTNLEVTALGGSISTQPEGVLAEVIEVHSLREVEQLGRSRIEGKIVFYNRAMDPNREDAPEAYGSAVDQRTDGAAIAAKYGAVATLVRSITALADDVHPHTGVMDYDPRYRQIPAAALSTHSANVLSQYLKSSSALKFELKLSAQNHPPVISYNVIGEITGSELPNEYVVVGGHLDSWDLSHSAHDNATGATQALEVARVFHALQLRPKRTLRVVLFMSEEFGGIGGLEYAKQAKIKNEVHIGAIESDHGGFSPVGMAVDASTAVLNQVSQWARYIDPTGAHHIFAGWSGTDVEPLNELGCATFGLSVDTKTYFNYHHSALDTIDNVNANDHKRGAALMATWAYLLTEEGLR